MKRMINVREEDWKENGYGFCGIDDREGVESKLYVVMEEKRSINIDDDDVCLKDIRFNVIIEGVIFEMKGVCFDSEKWIYEDDYEKVFSDVIGMSGSVMDSDVWKKEGEEFLRRR